MFGRNKSWYLVHVHQSWLMDVFKKFMDFSQKVKHLWIRWLLYNMDYIYILTYIHTHTYIPTYIHIYIYVYTYIYIIRPDFLRLLWEMTDVHQLIISKKTTTHFTSHDFPIVEMITTVDYFTIILLLLFSSTPRLPTVPSNLKTIVVIVKNTNN